MKEFKAKRLDRTSVVDAQKIPEEAAAWDQAIQPQHQKTLKKLGITEANALSIFVSSTMVFIKLPKDVNFISSHELSRLIMPGFAGVVSRGDKLWLMFIRNK